MRTSWRAHAAALATVGVATLALAQVTPVANETTIALAFVLVVLGVAARWQSGPAITASCAAAMAYNFFFLRPVGAFTIADPRNWVALGAMLVVSIAVGELSRRVMRRAAEAESSRLEAERLLHRLQDAFEREAELEATRRSERLKASLLDGVTHDLRTPLTSIKASVTALLADDRSGGLDPAARRELLEVMDEESDRLNGLVEQLLSTARIESSGLRLAQVWSSLDDILAAAAARVEPRLRGQTIARQAPAELPAVRVDARALEEAVYLLLENAARYAPAGTGITLGARVIGDEIEIVVEDEGPGVPPAERLRVFEPFTRGTTASGIPGLGMGLAIVRGLIEAHGGTVVLGDPATGTGARFVIRLPIGDDEEA